MNKLQLDKFAREYFIDQDVGRAARACGVKEGTGRNWLKERRVQNRLAELAREQANRLEMKADEVTQELSKIARAELPQIIKVQDKLKALELLGRKHRLFEGEEQDSITQVVVNIHGIKPEEGK